MERKNIIKAVFIVAFVIIAGIVFCVSKSQIPKTHGTEIQIQKETESPADFTEEVVHQTNIQVYICGEIKSPGVYTLDKNARINDLVQVAKGFTKKADKQAINLAKPLVDGEQITVPSKGKKKTSTSESLVSGGTTESGLVNINTASVDELTTLTGIGESRAQDIISFREENGGFQVIEDLMKVRGIKNGIFDKIKNQITT